MKKLLLIAILTSTTAHAYSVVCETLGGKKIEVQHNGQQLESLKIEGVETTPSSVRFSRDGISLGISNDKVRFIQGNGQFSQVDMNQNLVALKCTHPQAAKPAEF